ncbi:MAG: putative YigZ family protein [Oleispira sp.]
MGHRQPASDGFFELVEKRSRFITYCEKVSCPEEFKQFLHRLKKQYPDSRHVCYGFRIGPLIHAQRGFSDDGEPSGTAGMPILNVIDHSEFSDIAIIVVRYFGGTKLGTGGLARAYSEAASNLIKSIKWVEYEAKQVIKLHCQFQQEHQLRYLIKQLAGEIETIEYSRHVELSISIAEDADLSTLGLYRVNLGDD